MPEILPGKIPQKEKTEHRKFKPTFGNPYSESMGRLFIICTERIINSKPKNRARI